MDEVLELIKKARSEPQVLFELQELSKGDKPGHPFRGNQHTGGISSGESAFQEIAKRPLASRLKNPVTVDARNAGRTDLHRRDYGWYGNYRITSGWMRNDRLEPGNKRYQAWSPFGPHGDHIEAESFTELLNSIDSKSSKR